MPSFTYAQFEPVGQCNLKCRMCPITFRRDGPPHGPLAFMDLQVYRRLLDQMPGLEELHLQGLGEPMMHPRFFDMVEMAVRRGITVSTNTNLTLLNPERARRCVTSGLDTVHVSIDGATPEVYESIRLGSKLGRVFRNLDLLVAARREAGGGRPGLRLVTVVMRQNLHELAEVVRIAHRYEFAAMFVQHLCHDFAESTLPAEYRPMRDFVEGETLLGDDPARIEREFARARSVAAELGVDLRLPSTTPREHPPSTPGPERCDWPWKGPYISYQGIAMPCCMVATPDRANLGSMAEHGVAAIWDGPRYAEFRRRLGSDDPPEVCKGCSVYRRTF